MLSVKPAELALDAPPLTRAQGFLVVAHAATALVCLHLRTAGIAPTEHPVATDVARVSKYVEKVRAEHERGAEVDEKPKAAIDVGAASRFIEHAIPDLTVEQRRLVRAAGSKQKRRSEEVREKEAEREEARELVDQEAAGREEIVKLKGNGSQIKGRQAKAAKKQRASLKEEVAAFLSVAALEVEQELKTDKTIV